MELRPVRSDVPSQGIERALTSKSSALMFSIPKRLEMSISISCPNSGKGGRGGGRGRARSGNMLVVPHGGQRVCRVTKQMPKSLFARRGRIFYGRDDGGFFVGVADPRMDRLLSGKRGPVVCHRRRGEQLGMHAIPATTYPFIDRSTHLRPTQCTRL